MLMFHLEDLSLLQAYLVPVSLPSCMRFYIKIFNQGWKLDIESMTESDLGGYREIVFEVHGKGAYSRLKFESGVHRMGD